MLCLMCDDRIEVKEDAKLGEWRYLHTSGVSDHPAVLKPEPMTMAAHKERAWFNAWGFRRTSRSMTETMAAKTWFDHGWEARGEWDNGTD